MAAVNASTDRELTVYSAKVPAAAAERGLEVVSELVLRPLLRKRDLSAEKPVIVDEIRMYEDSPGDHIFTLFDEALFRDHPLAEIAGTPRSVRRATREGVVDHWGRWYQPRHLVLAAAGAVTHEAVRQTAAGWFEQPTPWLDDARQSVPQLTAAAPSPAGAPGRCAAHRRLAQGNLCLGMPGVARDDPDRWALDLLGAVLGDGMSSRLFLELRERRSLAYDVSTFAATYSDCGTFGVHAGFDPDQAGAVIAAIGEQLERVVQEPVSAAELERARAYTRGRLELRMEETSAVAAWLGTGEPAAPDPDRGRGGGAAGGGHARRPAAGGAPMRAARPGPPGAAGSVPVGGALREGAGRRAFLMARMADVGRERRRPHPGRPVAGTRPAHRRPGRPGRGQPAAAHRAAGRRRR